MTIREIVAAARKDGYTLSVEGDRLGVRPPPSGDMRKLLISKRVDIVAFLLRENETELMPPPGDVSFGNDAPPEPPAQTPAAHMPPRHPVDMSHVEKGGGGESWPGGGGESRPGARAFNRGDDVDGDPEESI